ncbi:MAG: riboflavin biosynthesis protein RibF [Muribaculaceae bacterium]|nr:riboflavin biosynthesis protein RibF [Muribaculaceae bacterium]
MSSLIATIGSFDGVHLGHRHILNELVLAARERDLIPAVVTFSNHPLEVIAPEKAPALLSSPEEKRNLLMAAGPNVVIMSPFTPEVRAQSASRFLENLRDRYDVTTLLLGFNNKFGNDPGLSFADYQQIASELGMEIIRSTEASVNEQPVSSTIIRKLLTENALEEANTMLGRPYSITGKVVHGRQIGRTLGFPTANILPDFPRKLIPGKGVYACNATLSNGKSYPAMVNIGERPTLNDDSTTVTIEAHIIGINRKLYGETVTLQFLHFLRNEKKFHSLDQLRDQLQIDKIQAINILEFSNL